MRSITWTFVSVALLGAGLVAQGRQGRQGRQGMASRIVGPMIAAAADADHNGEVTKKEWDGLVDHVTAKEGALDVGALKARLLAPMLDANMDRKLGAKDFAKMWKSLDKDGDGTIAAEELSRRRNNNQGNRQRRGRRGTEGGDQGGQRGRQRRQGGQRGDRAKRPARNRNMGQAARMLAAAADTDHSGEVTADEWKELVSSFKANDEGQMDAAAVAAKVLASQPKPKEPDAGDAGGGRRRRGRGGSLFSRLDRFLDADQNGKTEVADLTKVFEDLDKNADGTLQKSELKRQNRRRRR